jgi:hypothetical protein
VNSVLRAMNFDGGCRTADTPLPSKTQCKLSDCPQKGPAGDADRDFMADKNYLGHLGTLSWVQRVCRPDLAHACGCLARVGHNPGKAHWTTPIELVGRGTTTTARARCSASTQRGRAAPWQSRRNKQLYLFQY